MATHGTQADRNRAMLTRATAAPAGRPLEVFRQNRGEAFAGLIISGVVFVVGLSILGFVARDFVTSTRPRTFSGPGLSWSMAGLLVFVGLVLIGLGLIVVGRMRLALTFRAELYPEGLRIVDTRGDYLFWWDWVESVVEENVQDYLPVLHVAPAASLGVPVGKSLYLTLERSDGIQYRLRAEHVQGLPRLRRLLHDEATRRDIPWLVSDVDDGPVHTPLSGR